MSEIKIIGITMISDLFNHNILKLKTMTTQPYIHPNDPRYTPTVEVQGFRGDFTFEAFDDYNNSIFITGELYYQFGIDSEIEYSIEYNCPEDMHPEIVDECAHESVRDYLRSVYPKANYYKL